MTPADDFYEDDEPIESIRRAWRESTDGGWTEGPREPPLGYLEILSSSSLVDTLHIEGNTLSWPPAKDV